MSITQMTEVWKLDLNHSKRMMLLALADHAHDDGTKCHPGVPYLAWKTGYSERQVRRILAALEEDDLIDPQGEKIGGRGHATEYHLHLEKGVKKSPYSPKKKGDISAEKGDIRNTKGDNGDRKGDTVMSPQPSEPSGEPSNEPLVPTTDDLIGLFVDYLAEVRGARETPKDSRRPVPKSGTRSKGSLSRHIKRELEDGRDPALVEKAVRRIALRWDDYPMELAEAMGDVLDGKPWTVEGERKNATGGPPISGEEGAARRREGYEVLFDRSGPRSPRRRASLEPEPEPEPWEGSAFEDLVPHERWGDFLIGSDANAIAGAIKARVLELAVTDGEAGETFAAAIQELREAPWVGEPFKKRVIAEAELIREERSEQEAV